MKIKNPLVINNKLKEYYKELSDKLKCPVERIVEIEGDGKHLNSYFGSNELMIETLYLGLTLSNIFIGDISLVTDIEGNRYVMEKGKESIKIYSNIDSIPVYSVNKTDIRSRFDIKLESIKLAIEASKIIKGCNLIDIAKDIEQYLLSNKT